MSAEIPSLSPQDTAESFISAAEALASQRVTFSNMAKAALSEEAAFLLQRARPRFPDPKKWGKTSPWALPDDAFED